MCVAASKPLLYSVHHWCARPRPCLAPRVCCIGAELVAGVPNDRMIFRCVYVVQGVYVCSTTSKRVSKVQSSVPCVGLSCGVALTSLHNHSYRFFFISRVATHHGSKKDWMTGQSTFGELHGGKMEKCSLLLAKSLTKPTCRYCPYANSCRTRRGEE